VIVKTRREALSKSLVLDSYALIVYLENEPSSDQFERILLSAAETRTELCLSLISYGELLYIVERERGLQGLAQVEAMLEDLGVRLVQVDRATVAIAAHLKAWHRISYADAFAAALAQQLAAPVVTGDPEFRDIEGEVTVEWLDLP